MNYSPPLSRRLYSPDDEIEYQWNPCQLDVSSSNLLSVTTKAITASTTSKQRRTCDVIKRKGRRKLDLIKAEMEVILCGLATSNEGDAYGL